MEKKRKQILEGNLIKVLLFLTAPLVLNEFLKAFNDLIDSLFNKGISADTLKVMSFVEPNVNFLFAICTGMTIAATALVARSIAKRNYANAKKTITSALLLLAGIGVGIGLIGFIFAPQIMSLLGGRKVADGELFDTIVFFFRMQAVLLPIRFISELFFVTKRAQGSMFSSMIISVISMTLKIIFAIIFVRVLDMGLLGLGLSTLISSLFIVGALIYTVFINKSELRIQKQDLKIEKKVMVTLILMSVPLIFEKTLFSFSHIIINVHMGRYADTVREAYAITNKLNQFIFSTGTGFGMVLVTLISQCFAAGKEQRAEKIIKLTSIVSIVTTGLMLIILFALRGVLIPIFTDNPETILKTTQAMNIYSGSALAWSVMQIVIGVFQGSGHNKFSVVISFARLFAFRLPVLYLMTAFANFENPEFSVWYCMLIANVLTAVVAVLMYFFVDWRKTPKLLQRNEEVEVNEV